VVDLTSVTHIGDERFFSLLSHVFSRVQNYFRSKGHVKKNYYIRKWKNNKEEIKKTCINEDCYDDGLQEAT